MGVRWQPLNGTFTAMQAPELAAAPAGSTSGALALRRLGPWNDEALAEALDVLSNPVRLAIARALKEPRCLSEIAIAPTVNARESRFRGTLLARQTVKEHLDRLVAVGIVSARKVRRTRGELTQYVLNAECFSAISEAILELARSFEKPDLPAVEPVALASTA